MKTVILLSGGIDSTVLLTDYITQRDECLAITFDYGQTHAREIAAAKQVAAVLGAEWRLIPLQLGGSALTGDGDIPDRPAADIDATYVPARNIVMLAIAASIAEQTESAAVLFGANSGDRAGYPDCRPEFVTAMDHAVSVGTRRGVSICAPYLCRSKADIVALGRRLDAPLGLTWSCYRGGPQPCGRCGACELRREAMA